MGDRRCSIGAGSSIDYNEPSLCLCLCNPIELASGLDWGARIFNGEGMSLEKNE